MKKSYICISLYSVRRKSSEMKEVNEIFAEGKRGEGEKESKEYIKIR